MSYTSRRNQLTRLIEFILRSIFKKYLPAGQRNRKHTRYIHTDDVILCARLSVYYQEVMLAKLHLSKIRISKSKCVQADHELKHLLSQTPELVDFVLRTGDPGKYLLKTKFIEIQRTSEVPSGCITFDINDLEFLFTTVTQYSFYSRRKKKMPAEFSIAENNIRKVVEQYHLPGQFSWHRGNRDQADVAFMDEYGSIPSSSEAPPAMLTLNSRWK